MAGLTRALGVVAAGLGGAGYWASMSPYAQLLGPFPYRSTDAGHTIALTFDDGPNEPYTSQIADHLESRGIRGTFFQVGKAVRAHPEVTVRLTEAGHVVGHHSDRHQFTRCLSRATLRQEIEDGLRAFADVGLHPALYRPPWLLRVPALFPLLREYGLQPISGTFCHPLEFVQPPAPRIARAAIAQAHRGAILIFHDGFDGHAGDRSQTVRALREVVDGLQRRGYCFTTVDELLGVPAYRAGSPAGHPAPIT
jgi:peptidoglycan/xylan/chitin deacetylase (PgdA/CDA1 family)